MLRAWPRCGGAPAAGWTGWACGGRAGAAAGARPRRAGRERWPGGRAGMRWGAGRGVDGVVLMLTLGTGIGTSLFVGGRLVPNTELGHIEIRGEDAEHRAADGARKREDLNWKQYAGRLDEYLHKIEDLLWPDLIVVGGGISKKAEKFFPLLTARTEIVTAKMRNEAGIAGAALAGIPDQETAKAADRWGTKARGSRRV